MIAAGACNTHRHSVISAVEKMAQKAPLPTGILGWRGQGGGLTAFGKGGCHADGPAHMLALWNMSISTRLGPGVSRIPPPPSCDRMNTLSPRLATRQRNSAGWGGLSPGPPAAGHGLRGQGYPYGKPCGATRPASGSVWPTWRPRRFGQRFQKGLRDFFNGRLITSKTVKIPAGKPARWP